MTGAKSNILEAIGAHADRQAAEGRAPRRRRHLRQVRVPEPGRLDEGPGGAATSSATPSAGGLLGPGGTIVEATSGNTGMGLALVAALRGYACVFVMPDKMSQEKVAGAARVRRARRHLPDRGRARRPAQLLPDGQAHRRRRRRAPSTRTSTTTRPTPTAHYLSTAPEIWEQTGGEVDVFVAGMGTGGTISGCGRYFKEKKPGFQLVGVDPIGSLYYEYVKTGRMTRPFAYYVEGIGEDFLPSTMNLKIIDEIVRVDDKECFLMTRELVRQEGLFVGGSSGAAVAGAIKYAEASQAQGEHPGAAARRRVQVSVEDLRRQVDARERLPRRARSAGHGRRAPARQEAARR